MVNDVVANNSTSLDGRPTFCQRKMNVFVVILMSLLLVSLLVVSAAASGGQHGASELRGPSDFRMFMHTPYVIFGLCMSVTVVFPSSVTAIYLLVTHNIHAPIVA